MAVLSILAGVVVPRVGHFTDKARFARAKSDLVTMLRVAEHVYSDMGVYPGDANRGIDPGLADPARVPAARLSTWEGPYLAAWPSTHPWDGPYDYEYWNYSGFNFDGNAGNEVLISMRAGDLTGAILQRLDEELDDGDRDRGKVRHNNSNWLGMYIGEGPRW